MFHTLISIPLFILFSSQEIKWVKVPSHVNVMGNEQANTLANQGRVNSPLYPVKGTPHGRYQHHTCTPHRTAKKPKPPVRGTSLIRPLALDFDGVAGPRGHNTPPGPAPPHLPPLPCLSDLGLHRMPDGVDSFSPAHSVLIFLHTPSPTRSSFSSFSPADANPPPHAVRGGPPPPGDDPALLRVGCFSREALTAAP